jgi:hypothetical protein
MVTNGPGASSTVRSKIINVSCLRPLRWTDLIPPRTGSGQLIAEHGPALALATHLREKGADGAPPVTRPPRSELPPLARLRGFHPGWFGAVMGTAIVAVADPSDTRTHEPRLDLTRRPQRSHDGSANDGAHANSDSTSEEMT